MTITKFIGQLLCVLFLASCVDEGRKQAQCTSREVFDVSLKQCVSARPGNHAPLTGADQSVTTTEEVSVNFNLPAGTDSDGDTLYYRLVQDPAGGTITNC